MSSIKKSVSLIPCLAMVVSCTSRPRPQIKPLIEETKKQTIEVDANKQIYVEAQEAKDEYYSAQTNFVDATPSAPTAGTINSQAKSLDVKTLESESQMVGKARDFRGREALPLIPRQHAIKGKKIMAQDMVGSIAPSPGDYYHPAPPQSPIYSGSESYDSLVENTYLDPYKNPLSTFSIDVDTASYANVRRFLNQNTLPPKDAVRIEELINYFNYDYKAPKSGPFAVHLEASRAPWNTSNYLVRIGLKGKEIAFKTRPASNLVFLIDVSGSMNSAQKLPLLKSAFTMLLDKLDSRDKVSIVVYAGAAGTVLSPTLGSQKHKILEAIDRLQAGGSTNGGQGIQLAYSLAQQNFIKGGVNRVILATDGDFNVGMTSTEALNQKIKTMGQKGVYLSVLGFGMGNYKDARMEELSNKGNGNYYYIDSLREARKVLVDDMTGTLVTIAKDVKIQVEFNPKFVSSYRLIGYENRKMKDEDFNNDKKDAGDIGTGHKVTALYEIVPVGAEGNTRPGVDRLKYQEANKIVEVKKPVTNDSDELLTVKLRYKRPDGDTSKLMEVPFKNAAVKENASDNLKFASSVALFGMLLRNSSYAGQGNFQDVLNLAQAGKGDDSKGYRAEFIQLVKKASQLKGNTPVEWAEAK